MLAAELEQLVGHARELDRPVVALLRPGIDAGQVEAVIGSPVPESVAEWFRWCNGVEIRPNQIQDDVNIIPGYNPLSIDEAVAMAPDYAGDEVLGENWLPILGTAGGDIYAAVWVPGEEAQVAGVLIGEETEVEFSSIEQMASVFNACYRGRAFGVDQQGRLALDSQIYDQIYSQIVGR
jgi:hypothetical protein